MARVIGRLVLPDSTFGTSGLGGGSSEPTDFFDTVVHTMFKIVFFLITFLLLLTFVLNILFPTKTTPVLLETQMTKAIYHAPYTTFSSKVTHHYPARYSVCFIYQARTVCGDNKTLYTAFNEGLTNIIVTMDVITNKDDKITEIQVKSMILDH